jgi:hypothetical protein
MRLHRRTIGTKLTAERFNDQVVPVADTLHAARSFLSRDSCRSALIGVSCHSVVWRRVRRSSCRERLQVVWSIKCLSR